MEYKYAEYHEYKWTNVAGFVDNRHNKHELSRNNGYIMSLLYKCDEDYHEYCISRLWIHNGPESKCEYEGTHVDVGSW